MKISFCKGYDEKAKIIDKQKANGSSPALRGAAVSDFTVFTKSSFVFFGF